MKNYINTPFFRNPAMKEYLPLKFPIMYTLIDSHTNIFHKYKFN